MRTSESSQKTRPQARLQAASEEAAVRPWQVKFRTGLLIAESAVLAALVLPRVVGASLPFHGIFLVIIALATAPTLFWWAWTDERLAEAGRSRQLWNWLRIATAAYGATMLSPILLIGWHSRDALPVALLAWVMVWHMLLIVLGVFGLGAWLLRRVQRMLSYGLAIIAGRPGNLDAADPPADHLEPAGVTRRSFLATTMAAAPVALAGGTAVTALRQQGRFRVRRIQMNLPRLPKRLAGLTITHISDLHVGRLYRPEHLPALVEAVNRLDSDLLAITGDAVDHSFDYMPAACEAFAQMQNRYGRYIVIGNHDLIDSPRQAVAYLGEHEPNFLANTCRDIQIGGERLRIAGLFWSRDGRVPTAVPYPDDRLQRMLTGADPDLFTLALAHHPHTFDPLAAAGVDLTLAGHTHGGQIMLTPPGFAYPIGGGSLLFRYIWGEYRRGRSALYVTSGVGNWFPVRINAPAEVVQIQLV